VTSSGQAIALVVVTLDRTDTLRRCALAGVTAAAERGHEVLVVDQGPPDGPTARLLAGVPGVRRVSSPRGLSCGRNVALRETSAPLLAFTDDDVRIPDDWLERLLPAFDDPRVGAVCGRAVDPKGRLLPGAADGTYAWPSNPYGLGSGFALGLRRAAMAAVGPFDEALGAGGPFRAAEDVDVLYRMLRAGWLVRCTDSATVVHDDGRGFLAQLRVHHAYGYGAGAQLVGHALAGDEHAAGMLRGMLGKHVRGAGWALWSARPWAAALQVPYLAGVRRGSADRRRAPAGLRAVPRPETELDTTG
jgi:hypothetical protein